MRKIVFEPCTDTTTNTSEYLTKTTTETSKENNKALGMLNNELSEILNNSCIRGIISSYLMSPVSKVINFEHTSHPKLL